MPAASSTGTIEIGQSRSTETSTSMGRASRSTEPAPVTWYLPSFGRYILDYDRRDEPGNTIALPDGSGGHFLVMVGTLSFRFGTGG